MPVRAYSVLLWSVCNIAFLRGVGKEGNLKREICPLGWAHPSLEPMQRESEWEKEGVERVFIRGYDAGATSPTCTDQWESRECVLEEGLYAVALMNTKLSRGRGKDKKKTKRKTHDYFGNRGLDEQNKKKNVHYRKTMTVRHLKRFSVRKAGFSIWLKSLFSGGNLLKWTF